MTPVLFICAPSTQADRTAATLRSHGLNVTRADNICVAEMYAEAEPFEAAIYYQSLSQEDQASLARVMRIRWPWIKIIRWVPPGAPPPLDEALFDCTVLSESELTSCIEGRLR